MRPKLKPLGALVLVGTVVIGGYLLLPDPGPRVRNVELTDVQLRELVAAHRTPALEPMTSEARQLAKFGRALFHDQALSSGDRACVTCHGPEAPATSGGMSIPSLDHAAARVWFGAAGSTDSLAAEALRHLEDPRFSGTDRVHVVRHVLKQYAHDYAAAFGAVTLPADLPEHAAPKLVAPDLPITTSARALQTLGDSQLLSEILSVAQEGRRAPAIELARRALAAPTVDDVTEHNWKDMPEASRRAVDRVFANVGRALAAYIGTLVTEESAFDRFAMRLHRAPERPVSEILDLTFGPTELAGFKLFHGPGRCAACHAGPEFSDHDFHNIGLPQRGDSVALGRIAGIARVLADPFNCQNALDPRAVRVGPPAQCAKLLPLSVHDTAMLGAFKTPSLRRVTLTAPYMHDGRFETLDDVIDHYDDMLAKPALGKTDERLQPLQLTVEEREALTAFLTALAAPVKDLSQVEPIGQK
jgi:cytochrome c peroxidase